MRLQSVRTALLSAEMSRRDNALAVITLCLIAGGVVGLVTVRAGGHGHTTRLGAVAAAVGTHSTAVAPTPPGTAAAQGAPVSFARTPVTTATTPGARARSAGVTRRLSTIAAPTTSTSRPGTASTTSTTQGPPATGGTLPEWAYVRTPMGAGSGLAAVNLRTGATTAVPDATGWMAVSPDRAHIVYQTNQPGGVAVAGPGAANPHPVTDPQTHVGYAWFTWAPDSSRVAYMARPAGGGGYDIFTAAADGSDVHQLTTGANVRYEVPDGPKMAWSPDGRTIAFISDQGNGSSVLEIVAVSTGAVTPVTPADGQYMTVVGWLPDGQTLLATTSSWRMVLVPVGGGAVRTVTTDNTLEANPALSPDGQWIAYERGSGGGPLVVVRTNGTGGHVLVSAGLGSYPGPSWSPDGRNILFTWDTNSGHAGGTSYVNATGGSTTAVHSGADIDAVW